MSMDKTEGESPAMDEIEESSMYKRDAAKNIFCIQQTNFILTNERKKDVVNCIKYSKSRKINAFKTFFLKEFLKAFWEYFLNSH